MEQVKTADVVKNSLGFRKPAKIPAKSAPTGAGTTKGDILLQRLATEFRVDPLAELVKLAKRSDSEKIKKEIYSELMSYYMPKMKAIDNNPHQGETINVSIIFPEEENSLGGSRD